MLPAKDTFLFRELQVIEKIIQDETWLEGERRGCYVSPDDPVVRERVCCVVLRIGQSLRESVTRSMESKITAPSEQICPDSRHATAA